VFHARDRWIREYFGQAEGEGLRFVKSEINYLRKHDIRRIPSAILRTGLKLTGYKLGNSEQRLPNWLKRRLSMNRQYWQKGVTA
ncbi:MAG: rhamnosyltransferase, partial [Candidatus Zixiibacteriota bacterium]